MEFAGSHNFKENSNQNLKVYNNEYDNFDENVKKYLNNILLFLNLLEGKIKYWFRSKIY